MKCKQCQDHMVEAHYGELADNVIVEFNEHVASCADCSSLSNEIASTLGAMNQRRRVDPGAEFWDGYYARLEARMKEKEVALDRTHTAWWKRSVLGGAGSRSSWAYRVAAAVVLIGVGVVADRIMFSSPTGPITPEQVATAPAPGISTDRQSGATAEEPTTAQEPGTADVPTVAQGSGTADAPMITPDNGTPAPSQAQVASARAMRYVDKSQMLLLALVNTDPDEDGSAAGLETQRERSQALLEEAPTIRESLNDPKQRRLRELVGELEKILREIANLEEQDDVEAVEVIRGSVNRNDVMLKINLEQMRYGSGEKPVQRDDV